MGGASDAAIDTYDFLDPVDVLGQMPKDFFTRIVCPAHMIPTIYTACNIHMYIPTIYSTAACIYTVYVLKAVCLFVLFVGMLRCLGCGWGVSFFSF